MRSSPSTKLVAGPLIDALALSPMTHVSIQLAGLKFVLVQISLYYNCQSDTTRWAKRSFVLRLNWSQSRRLLRVACQDSLFAQRLVWLGIGNFSCAAIRFRYAVCDMRLQDWTFGDVRHWSTVSCVTRNKISAERSKSLARGRARFRKPLFGKTCAPEQVAASFAAQLWLGTFLSVGTGLDRGHRLSLGGLG